jgi:hypothetical protein
MRNVRRTLLGAFVLAAVSVPLATAATPITYAGRGNATIKSFTLKKAATLKWETSGGMFGGLFALKVLNQRADIPNPQLVFSKARSGTVRLPAGRYALRVDVLAGTEWIITIR